MDLADLKAFVRIAELGSVSAAARALNLPKSTISRALVRLEASTRSILIERSTRHLRLTDAGVLFRPYAERILADVDEAATALDGFAGTPRGTLRVNAPYTFAVGLIAPMLPAFMARYPDVRVVLDVENRIIDMPVEAADLVIRIGSLPDTDLIARKLMTLELWTCAAPHYLAKRGMPSSVSGLVDHDLFTGFNRPMTWAFHQPDGTVDRVDVAPDHVMPEPAALAIVLEGGAGIGRLPDFLARESVAAGRLVHLFPAMHSDRIEVHALYPSHRSLSAKVRVFIDSLVVHLDPNRRSSAAAPESSYGART